MPLTKVSFSVIQVDNNVTSTTVGNTTSIPSFTFDQNGVITSASNTAISGAGITANTIANSAFQTGSVENYLRANTLDFGMRNRIINGAMRFDQRNAGASVNGNATYSLDRWLANASANDKYTVQQDSSANTAAGFASSLKVTSSSAYTVGASEQFSILQVIEGFNTADLDFGKSTAKTVTLSFWVRSSLTGTFGGALFNAAANRSYPYSYTISAANTWEQKSVTIAGDTTGTWVGATNGASLYVAFSLGSGSTLSGTAGAWAGSLYFSATGATSVVGTSGATWYVTGVQLEEGSQPTPFEYRQYGTELALCQRYYWQQTSNTSTSLDAIATGSSTNSTTGAQFIVRSPVTMRSSPTFAARSQSGFYVFDTNAFVAVSSISIYGTISSPSATLLVTVNSAVSAAHRPTTLHFTNTSGSVEWLSLSAEL